MAKMQLVVPMSGQGTRFQKAGYKDPKPLIRINGQSIIERLLGNFPLEWPTVFVLAENHRHTGLVEHLKELRPQCTIDFIAQHSLGPGKALEQGLQHLKSTDPVLVSYCDYGMVWDARRFESFVESSKCDACLISYRGFHAHYLTPMNYAYSRLDGERVVQIQEKNPFTANRENEFASSGGYYFRSAELLKQALKFQFDQKLQYNGEYYTSLTTQALIQMNKDAQVRVFEIPGFFQWGTPDDLETFAYWERCFSAWNRVQGLPKTLQNTQCLLPMAGLGSRFQTLSQLPKPMIKIGERQMFLRALESLPVQSAMRSIVCLEGIASQVRQADPKAELEVLSETPAGQALSVKAGLELLNETDDILITACDHEVVMASSKWDEFKKLPDTDAAIFTIKGFPGTLRKPLSYSYVRTNDEAPFALVQSVSVKRPLTEVPAAEPLLVGSFWFKDLSILKKGLRALEDSDSMVNNELYLDGIFNELIKLGHTVREIPLDGYINWGDPDSMKEALYWLEVFSGKQLQPRPAFGGVNFQ